MLPSFPQRGQPNFAMLELPDDAPKVLKDWIGKIKFTQQMIKWFGLIPSEIGSTADVALQNQAAAIGPTPLDNTADPGLYLLAYYIENTGAGGTAQLSVAFSDDVGATTPFTSLAVGPGQRDSGGDTIRLASGNVTWQVAVTGAPSWSLFMTMEKLQ